MKTIHSARMLLLNISIEAASKSLLFYIEHRPAQHFGMVRACGSPGRFDELVDQGCRVLLGNPRHTEQRREALSSLNWTTLATGRRCGAVDLVSRSPWERHLPNGQGKKPQGKLPSSIAQLVERSLRKREVVGSNPTGTLISCLQNLILQRKSM